MASANDGRKIEGKNEPQKTLLERKKADFFKQLNEAGEELWKISQEEEESFEIEIAQLKEKQEKLIRSLDDKTAYASECDGKIERLEAELGFMKEKIAVCEREHGGTDDVNVMKEELKTLKRQILEQCYNSFREAVQSYLETQHKQNRMLLRKHSSVKDELTALRRLSAETQQREQNETKSTSNTVEQHQQQHSTGKS